MNTNAWYRFVRACLVAAETIEARRASREESFWRSAEAETITLPRGLAASLEKAGGFPSGNSPASPVPT